MALIYYITIRTLIECWQLPLTDAVGGHVDPVRSIDICSVSRCRQSVQLIRVFRAAARRPSKTIASTVQLA